MGVQIVDRPAERRLTRHGAARKQQILDAAEQLFASQGYARTRITDICQAAGVAKGLFYWYFDTKEALFVELVRSMRRRLRRVQAEAIAGSPDPVTSIRLATEASVHHMSEHVALFALVEAQRTDAAVMAVLVESADIYAADIERLIVEAQRAGLVAGDLQPRLAALAVMGTIGYLNEALRAGRATSGVDDLAAFAGRWVTSALGC